MNQLKGKTMKATSLEEAIQFAIEKEIQAKDTYQMLIEKASDPAARELFEELRDMEIDHQKRLENIDMEAYKSRQDRAPFVHMHLADYMTDIPLEDVHSFQDVLNLSIKMEARAAAMYSALADQHKDDPELFDFFQMMVKEETIHEDRLEGIYDDVVLKDN